MHNETIEVVDLKNFETTSEEVVGTIKELLVYLSPEAGKICSVSSSM